MSLKLSIFGRKRKRKTHTHTHTEAKQVFTRQCNPRSEWVVGCSRDDFHNLSNIFKQNGVICVFRNNIIHSLTIIIHIYPLMLCCKQASWVKNLLTLPPHASHVRTTWCPLFHVGTYKTLEMGIHCKLIMLEIQNNIPTHDISSWCNDLVMDTFNVWSELYKVGHLGNGVVSLLKCKLVWIKLTMS